MKNLIVLFGCVLVLSAGTALTAQNSVGNGNAVDQPSPNGDMNAPQRPGFLGRLEERLPEDLTEELEAIQNERRSIHEDLKAYIEAELEADPDKSLEVIREEFFAANEDRIEANKEASRALREEVREFAKEQGPVERPRDRRERPELPEELQAKIDTYREDKQTLRVALKAEIDALGEDATREQVQETIEAFRSANEVEYDRLEQVAAEIREEMKDFRGENGPERELPEELQVIRDEMKTVRRGMHQNRRELREALANATEEEREALIGEFRESQQEERERLRELHRAFRDQLKDLGGENRPGDGGE